MDNLLSNFADWLPLLVLCLSCYSLVHVIRDVVEALWPQLVNKPIWNPVALHVLPVLMGVIGSLPRLRFPFPEVVAVTSYRVILGGLLGFVSTMVYKGVKAYVAKQTGIDVAVIDSVPPTLKPEDPKP